MILTNIMFMIIITLMMIFIINKLKMLKSNKNIIKSYSKIQYFFWIVPFKIYIYIVINDYSLYYNGSKVFLLVGILLIITVIMFVYIGLINGITKEGVIDFHSFYRWNEIKNYKWEGLVKKSNKEFNKLIINPNTFKANILLIKLSDKSNVQELLDLHVKQNDA